MISSVKLKLDKNSYSRMFLLNHSTLFGSEMIHFWGRIHKVYSTLKQSVHYFCTCIQPLQKIVHTDLRIPHLKRQNLCD